MENRYAITLDFKQRPVFHVNFVQGNINTSVLEFRIVDGGQPVDISDQEVTVAFYKPDGTLVIQDNLTGVTVLDAEVGRVQCVLTSNTLAAVGIIKGEVNFDSIGTKLSTAQFIFNVTASLDNGDILMSINELPKLDAKLLDIQAQYNDDSTQWDSDVNNVIAQATNKIVETEAVRQLALTAKTAAETAAANTNVAIALANSTAETTRMNWKGTKNTFALLPSSGNSSGDAWSVIADTDHLKNGLYRHNGVSFVMVSSFNLTGYETVANVLSEAAYQAAFRRNQMHSGCIQLPIISGGTATLNTVTIPACDYNVDGNIVSMPQTVVTLPDPPTTGTREDLVFLEAYFPTNDPYRMVGRYRSVAGVDFSIYPEGLGVYNPGVLYIATSQGGNTAPLINTGNSQEEAFWLKGGYYVPTGTGGFSSTSQSYRGRFNNDYGIYVTGKGDSASKTNLQTYDGYSYAIPISRVKRRNSGGYSPGNPNGARDWFSPIFTNRPLTNIYPGGTSQWTIGASDYTRVQVGDVFTHATGSTVKITSKDENNLLTVMNINLSTLVVGGASSGGYYLVSDHPQSLYSNVIDTRDITDLRHRTQVQYNYDYELRKASDQFMRGEIGSSKKMMKVYHGIPKSEIDEHTVFYASLDGTTVPEFPVGSSAMNLGTGSFKPMPTGSGYKFNGDSQTPIAVSGLSKDYGTIDFFISTNDLQNSTNEFPFFVVLLNENDEQCIGVVYTKTTNRIKIEERYSDASTISSNLQVVPLDMPHINIRISWNPTKLYLSFNGKLINTTSRLSSGVQRVPSKIQLAGKISGSYTLKSTLSDVHISNIDRGSLFPNLPPDLISGDAVIMPKFTGQRKIFSQAQMTQTINGIAKINNADGTTRGIKTSRTSGNWASGDTIKVTGMAGELISGVFDTDTLLCKVIKYISGTGTTTVIFNVDKTEGLTVGDTVAFIYADGSGTSATVTIASIDTVTKNVTTTWSSSFSEGVLYKVSGATLIETTAASSQPLVKSSVGTIAGTWTPNTLGTNQATFTLGTNATLTNQDIQIDYSIIMPAGQPALTAPTTATLQGEAGFRVPYSKQTITTDLAGKIAGSTLENPNVVKTLSAIVANNPAPSTFVNELATSEYAKLSTQDGTVTIFSTSVNGEQACALLSFDLIKIAERKLGCKIPAKDIAGKVAWLKSNIFSFTTSCWGYGSSPGGNKARLIRCSNGLWSTYDQSNIFTSSSAIEKVYITTTTTSVSGLIQPDGFVHSLWCTDPSDGVTPSVINLDYASLDIKFADKVINSFKLVTGSTVHIRDDFDGKTAGSVVGNPNIMRYSFASDITTITATGGSENSQASGYDPCSKLDATLSTLNAVTNGLTPFQKFSFNLIRIYEDKYGSIPAIDKSQWLKDNLNQITFNWWGYGSSPAENKASIARWNGASWVQGAGDITTNSTVTKISPGIGITGAVPISLAIQSDGFVHFLAYSGSSNESITAKVYTDYCNIELTLKTPTGYDILVPENPRRDAGMSQILFVRRETKEVQTFAGRDTDLNLVSYSEYLPAPEPISVNTDLTILAEIPEFLITDLGSAVGYKQGAHHWMNPAYRVGQDRDELYGELGFANIPFAPDSVGINTGNKVRIGVPVPPAVTGFYGDVTKQFGLTCISKPLVNITRWLVLHGGELKLFVLAKYSVEGDLNTFSNNTNKGYLISMSGRPLSKEVEGIVRVGTVTPTQWKTSPLVPQGYVDKATGKLITTNNSI